MTKGNIFWILMLIWLAYSVMWNRGWIGDFGVFGNNLLVFVLFVLLGWSEFGPAIR